MRVRSLRRAGILAASIAVGATGAASVGATASDKARGADYAGNATIKIGIDGQYPIFTGSKEVSAGSQLKIIDTLKPYRVGPHTFSLVKKSELPTTDREMRPCYQFKGVCGRISRAIQADPDTGEVGKPDIDVGAKGWDTAFGKSGDTWYTETKGAIESREVTAKPGTLYYLCIIHPFMQGKIKVVE